MEDYKHHSSFDKQYEAYGAPDIRVGSPQLSRHGDLETGIVHERELKSRNPLFRLLRKAFDHGVEVRGIERVPEDERKSEPWYSLIVFWFSVNLVITTVPLGMLARPFFSLSYQTAVLVIVLFTAIGACGTAFIASLGPMTGLRTMVICRYSMGFVGASLFSALNIVTHLGFSVTGLILGGQTLSNVASKKLPLEAAVVIVGVLVLVISFFGYAVLRYWQRFAWIVMLTFYICMYALGGKKGYNTRLPEQLAAEGSGAILAGNVLSYAGIILPSVCGWGAVAADFNSRLPATYPAWRIFLFTWIGLMVPLMLVEILGAALLTIPDYFEAFKAGDVSGVLQEVFKPWGAGGKFIQVVFAFSIASNCTANTYATALAIQALATPLQKVPRAVWVIVAFVIYTVCAIAGREHFSAILNNFLSILGYWVAFFLAVVLEEHMIFRRRIIPGGYDLTAYGDIRRLPPGIAGIVSCCVAAVMAVLSMSQTWYVGPIARKIGRGGDIGFEVSFATAALLYAPLRWLEYRRYRR